MERETRRLRPAIALAVCAVIVAVGGIHLLELWLPGAAAFWISHGLALVLLGASLWYWRGGGRRAISGDSGHS